MSMAQVLIMSVVREGRSLSEVARDYGVSRRWLQKLLRRYESEGEAGFEPRSRRPHTSPRRTPTVVEELVVAAEGADRSGVGRRRGDDRLASATAHRVCALDGDQVERRAASRQEEMREVRENRHRANDDVERDGTNAERPAKPMQQPPSVCSGQATIGMAVDRQPRAVRPTLVIRPAPAILVESDQACSQHARLIEKPAVRLEDPVVSIAADPCHFEAHRVAVHVESHPLTVVRVVGDVVHPAIVRIANEP